MKKYLKLFALTLIVAISFTACNNELQENNSNVSGTEKEIKIVAGINGLSRTQSQDGSLTTTFVKDDEIGIFVYEGDKAVYSNVKYVYNGTSWTSDNLIQAVTGVQYKYYAYYPYNAEVTDVNNVSVTVNADQTGGYDKEDFLTAQNTEAAAGAEIVTLNFNHAFSLVQVGIKEAASTDANATVTLENIIPTANVDVMTGTVGAATGEATSVKMKKSATKMEYRAIVPAQTITASAKLLTVVAEGKTFTVSSSTDVNYEKGNALQITVNSLIPLPEGNEVTIGGSIESWEQGSDPGDGEVEEIPISLLDLTTFPGLDLSENNQTTKFTKNWANEKATGSNDFWFIRNVNNSAIYSLENKDDQSVLKIASSKQCTWNNDCVGFHSSGIYERAKYILTFDVVTDDDLSTTTDKTTIGFGIANSTDTGLFQMCKNDWSSNERNLHTFNDLSSTWATKTMWFNFENDHAGGRSSGINGKPNDKGEVYNFEPTDENDVKDGINIIFYNYTKNRASNIYIRNIKLTKYTE